MPEHHHASEAIYHPIPQAPVASNSIPPASPDLDLDDEVILSGSGILPTQTVVDSKIRWIHFMLGCAVLLPWNALITATPFFQSRLEGSSLRSTFSSYLSTTFTAANFVFLAHATATAKKASNTQRVLLSLGFLTVLSFTLTASTYVRPAPGAFFAFVLLNAVGQAVAGSYLQTAVVAIASRFGPSAMQAVMSGQAAVAVAISGVQVLGAAASVRGADAQEPVSAAAGEPEERSAFMFFALSTVFLVVCAGVHTWLVSLPTYKAVVARTAYTTRMDTDAAEGTGLLEEEGQREDDVRAHGKEDQKSHAVRLAKTNGTFNFAVAYVFVVTLAVFPPITVSVTSTRAGVHPLVFTAVHFLMFNVGDFGGRMLCSLPRVHVWAARRLLSLALLRTLFVPLFLLCNVQWASSASAGRAPLLGDAPFMLLMLAFGLSNGYVSSMCMMAAPSLAHNPRLRGRGEDVDVAATVASFCLVGGLALGSVLSFAVQAAVCDCNPFTV